MKIETNIISKKKIISIILFSVLSFISIFEILFRSIIPNSDSIFNILKVIIVANFMLYIILVKKKFKIMYKYIHFIWIIFLFIFIIKIFQIGSISVALKWLEQNNNINYIFIYLYFFIFTQIKDDINVKTIIKLFRKFNFTIIIISFILFFTSDYLGMVSYENMLAYSWVGTDKLRMMSIFGNPNQAGLYFTTMLFILDYNRVLNKSKLLCLENIMLILCNILTFSRTSIIIMSLYIVLRYFNISSLEKSNKFKKLLNKYKFLFIFLGLIILIYILVNKYGIYFFDKGYLFNSSRWERWRIGLDYISKNLLLGIDFNTNPIGYSLQYGQISFSDNTFIELGVYFGIILMILVFGGIIYSFLKQIKKNIIELNRVQIIIISGMLSGIIHFSVFTYLYLIYFIFFDRYIDKKN